MHSRFDQLTKQMAQSVTRRAALKKFGIGFAGMALACFGRANKAEAGRCLAYGAPCAANGDCCSGYCRSDGLCGCTTETDCAGNGRKRTKGNGYTCLSGYCYIFGP